MYGQEEDARRFELLRKILPTLLDIGHEQGWSSAETAMRAVEIVDITLDHLDNQPN